MVRRLVPAATFAALAVSTALGCQYLPFSPSDGQLQMRVEWPFRAQAIPANTAAVAVAVFKGGSLVPSPSGKKLTIIGRGSGTAHYPGLGAGQYHVVAVAYNGEVAPAAGGSTDATITVGASTQVTIDLNAAGSGNAGDLSPYIAEVEAYIKGAQPSPSTSPVASASPSSTTPSTPPSTTASTAPSTEPTAVPAPSPSATAATAAGGGGGGGSSSVTFTGGF